MAASVGSAFGKIVVQGINDDGTASKSSTNPGYFLYGSSIFSEQRNNNKVRFFHTGESYFQRAGEAIVNAKKSVFITGWQINYDVLIRAKDTKETTKLRKKLAKLEAERKQIYDRLNIVAADEQTISTKLGGTIDTLRLNSPYLGLDAKIEDLQEKIFASQDHQTLWQCLREALEKNPKLKIYVLPWLSLPFPKEIYTRCFETMLAIFQLNAGLEGEQRAFCVPAWGENSLMGLGRVFFSHHQKSIVIDNEIGFVGGLDLAYGRRDDEYFDLNGADRQGDDFYNGCIPSIATPPGDQYVTTLGLLLSTFIDSSTPSRIINAYKTVSSISTHSQNWWQVPMSNGVYLWLRDRLTDVKEYVSDFIDDAMIAFLDMMLLLLKTVIALANNQLTNQTAAATSSHTGHVKSSGMVAVADSTRPTIGVGGLLDQRAQNRATSLFFQQPSTDQTTNTIDEDLPKLTDGLESISSSARQQLQSVLDKLSTASKLTTEDYAKTLPAIMEWLEKTSFGQYVVNLLQIPKHILPGGLLDNMESAMETMVWYFTTVAQKRALKLSAPYHYLAKVPQPLFPKGGKMLNSKIQPRMPWHDVHVEIQGPSVHDLAHNFVKRWNSAQAKIWPRDLEAFKAVLSWSVSLFKQDTRNTIKGMLLWANDQLRQYQYIDELLNDLTFEDAQQTKIPQELLPPTASTIKAQQGEEATVQILRSASQSMLFGERRRTKEESMEVVVIGVQQTDCLKAWLQAISSATHFLYIENQFFQSDFGREFGYNPATLSGPFTDLTGLDPKYKDYLVRINWHQAWEQGDASLIDWSAANQIYVKNPVTLKGFLGDIWKAISSKAKYLAIRHLFEDVPTSQEHMQNPIVQALVERITLAIQKKENFHVYLLIPVHPEGQLNSDSLMNQVHLTMQTIYNGKKSLIRGIQRAIYVQKQRERIAEQINSAHPIILDENLDLKQRALAKNTGVRQNLIRVKKEVAALNQRLDEQERLDQIPDYINENDWNQYLTLLNLRNWTVLNNLAVTEQIYIHSKLLIADDDVAIIGSCNVNDRSMLGSRDSELAAIVRGTQKKTIQIDGRKNFQVSKVVHDFRVDLWKKIFALDMPKKIGRSTNIKPAKSLRACLKKPAAPSTWQEIQKVAKRNADAYEQVFKFIPQNNSPVQKEVKRQSREAIYPIINKSTKFYPLGCSIWPTWAYNDPDDLSKPGKKMGLMPFDSEFWLKPALALRYGRPKGIEGFITALPYKWTMGERNYNVTTGLHIYILAYHPQARPDYNGMAMASHTPPNQEDDNRA